MKKTILTFAILLLSGLLIAQDYTPPKTAVDAFNAKHPTAEVDEWVDFETEIICYFEENGNFGSAFFTLEGDWVLTEFNITESELPEDVMRELLAKYDGYEIMDITREINTDATVYNVYIYSSELEIDYLIILDQDGKIVAEEELIIEDDSFE